jgi:hypothetical protein
MDPGSEPSAPSPPAAAGVRPELLVVAAFSRHEAALAWGRARLEAAFGPVALASEPFPFVHTSYYERTMGAGLIKVFLAFQELVPPDRLAEVKRQTVAWEAELAAAGRFPEGRPLNLDPGLLGLGKLVLASTKDNAHRIYLHSGIWAEVTLRFQDGHFRPWPWTYRDYQEPQTLAFFDQARDYYRRRLALVAGGPERGPLVEGGSA